MDSFIVSNTQKRRTALYIRVSTAEQKIDGYSLEAQERRLNEYVNASPFLETKPSWFYAETHTGSDLNRPQLQRLLEDVRAGKYDAVLVWKIDRLSRSLKHLLSIFEEMQKYDVSFISIQENIDFKGPIGSLIFQIFGAIAQFERELIKGRTRMGRITSAELGNYTGPNIPYGYRPILNKGGKGKTLEAIPEEKGRVKEIYNWYIYEALGDGQIAKRLCELKVPKPVWEKNKETGKWETVTTTTEWSDKMVTNILTKSIYRGEFLANDTDDAGNLLPSEKWTIVSIPPCVSEFVFRQAEVIRSNKIGGSTDTDYLLSGKLIDVMLDKPLRFSGAKRSGGGFSYRRKQFDTADGEHIPVFEVPGKQLEEYVWGKILEAMKDPEIFVNHYLSKEYANPKKIEKYQMDLDNLRVEKVNTELAIERIEARYDRGNYSEEKTNEKVAREERRLTEIETKIQSIEDEISLMSSVGIEVQKLKEASQQVRYRLEKLDRRQQRVLCNLFVDKIEMRRIRDGKRWKVQPDIYFRFNPEKLKETAEKGRSQTQLTQAEKGSLKAKKVLNGGSGGI